MHKHIINLKNS